MNQHKGITKLPTNPFGNQRFQEGLSLAREDMLAEGYVLPITATERREQIALLIRNQIAEFAYNDYSTPVAEMYLKIADSVLALPCHPLPKLPLLTDEQIQPFVRLANDSYGDSRFLEGRIDVLGLLEAQRDLCRETLRKAGYEEVK